MYIHRPEVLEYSNSKCPKGEVETWQDLEYQYRCYDIKEQYKVQEILFINIIIIYWVNKW